MISALPVTGLGEVGPGDDVARLVADAVDLRDGDVLVVTSKVVSKSEGRVVTGGKEEALDAETARIVARRGPTTIVRTRHGLVMAAAGIDASNTLPGTLVLLPLDPDASARAIREALASGEGPNVGVLVSDTSGRAWRTGQTDIAVGAAGVTVLDDHAGRSDGYGNELAVTAPAVADEIAGAADLVTGKLSHSPAAVVRGLERFVLARGDHGPGAAALVRPEAQDMFGLGSREAVHQALMRVDPCGFGSPVSADELVASLGLVVPQATAFPAGDGEDATVNLTLPVEDSRRLGVLEERTEATAFALGWRRAPDEPAHVRAVPAPQPAGGTPGGTGLRFVPIRP